ncbi:MAG: helix-turn-helix transcriptional regulator [Comamonas sp.]
MSEAEKTIGVMVRALRLQKEMPIEALAAASGVSVGELAAIEAGEISFSVKTLERIAGGLRLPLRTLVVSAFEDPGGPRPPVLNPAYLRRAVPLPTGLTHDHLAMALNHTQEVIHKINRNMVVEVGLPLQGLIQGNNFSGLVSNVLSNSFDQCTPYKHNHHQRYPDLINPTAGGEGLEIKTTIQIGKGGESHNGHSGWHLIACFNFRDDGDIRFIHAMFGQLVGHQYEGADWAYVGSKTNATTGSRRTETYNTNLQGATKLRDGSAYLDPNFVEYARWRQSRTGACPPWSIFAAPPAARLF